jgi:hypothetical protein
MAERIPARPPTETMKVLFHLITILAGIPANITSQKVNLERVTFQTKKLNKGKNKTITYEYHHACKNQINHLKVVFNDSWSLVIKPKVRVTKLKKI